MPHINGELNKQCVRALPLPCHIQLELDCTKLWCGVESAPEPKELHYQPTVEEIFKELERQTGEDLEIPPEIIQLGLSMVLPLTDVEQEEEREAELYTIPFVEDLETPTMTLPRTSPTKRKLAEKRDKGKKAIEVEELSFDTEQIWRETFQSEEGIDFDDPIIQGKLVSITSKIVKKSSNQRGRPDRGSYHEENFGFISRPNNEGGYRKNKK
jgi:hypothetical protein